MKSSVRKQQWHTKTRTGCLTCKARKIKCDETHPVCMRCKSSGRKCEGYNVPKPQVLEVIQTPGPRCLNLIGENEEGLQGLQFFYERTTPILSNFSAFAADYWQYVVPRVATSDQTIRSLLIAIGSQQRETLTSEETLSDLVPKSARYYRRALIRLSDTYDPPEPVIILICCLLFIVLENIKRNNSGIYPHLSAGLKVLREWKTSRLSDGKAHSSSDDLIATYIEPFMARLEASASFVGVVPEQPLGVNDLEWKKFTVPTRFTDFNNARESWYELDQWLHLVARATLNFWSFHCPEYRDMLALWRRWREVLKLYQYSSEGARSKTEDWQLRLLDAHYKIHLIHLEVTPISGEMGWDAYTEKFRNILKTCIDFLDHAEESIVPGDAGEFAFVPGVLPLYSVATVCRDPIIRRECVKQMRRQHSLLHDDDCVTARMAEAFIDAEELGLGEVTSSEDITMERRIRPIFADVSEDGQILAHISRYPFVDTENLIINIATSMKQLPITMKLYPISELVMVISYQGLIRTPVKKCICKAFAGHV